MTWRRGALALAWVVGLVVGVPAVAITVSRLAGLGWRPAVELQAFTPLAIPAYVVVGLLLLLALVRTRRRLLLAPAALVVAALALQLTWAAPMVLGSAPAPGGRRLTVMTSNIETGDGDVTDIARAVRAHHVDLLAVEEITPAALARLQRSGALAQLPYHAGEPKGTFYGTMVFSRSPISDVRRLSTPMGSWALTTAGLRVMAVHPDSPLKPPWAANQATIRKAALREHPDLVLGDFNATLDHEPLRRILATGLSDAAQLTNAGWQPTWPADGYAGLPLPPGAAIDHVLVGHRLTAIRTSTVTVADTDHRSLIAEIATRR